jgi:hypothetical protein
MPQCRICQAVERVEVEKFKVEKQGGLAKKNLIKRK